MPTALGSLPQFILVVNDPHVGRDLRERKKTKKKKWQHTAHSAFLIDIFVRNTTLVNPLINFGAVRVNTTCGNDFQFGLCRNPGCRTLISQNISTSCTSVVDGARFIFIILSWHLTPTAAPIPHHNTEHRASQPAPIILSKGRS